MPVTRPAVVERTFLEVAHAPSNTLLASAGAESRVCFLEAGCAVREDAAGKALSVIWPGEFIENPTECRALTDCQCLLLSRADFDAACRSDIELASWLNEQMFRRNEELHERVDWFINRRAEERILSVLWKQTQRAVETTGTGAIPLAQLQVAQLAGATRETASMLLHRLREQGLIDYRRRSIQVSEPARLAQFLETSFNSTQVSA